MNKYGLFLTLEGVDGAGKSTHLSYIQECLEAHQLSVCVTREPGGTELGETLRELLLHHSMTLETECLLMFAARHEHIQKVILPALRNGQWVLCDRFTDASFAYQGEGRGLGAERVSVLEQWVHPGFQPDKTWLFDVPLEIARQRMTRTRVLDRFEQQDVNFFLRTQQGYYDRVHQDPDRFFMVDASRSIEEIRQQLQVDVKQLVQQWQQSTS